MASGALEKSTVVNLDRYADEVFACPPIMGRAGGVHLLPEPRRGLPWWHGFTLPIVGLSFREGTVVAVRPDLVTLLQAELCSDVHLRALDLAAQRRLHRAVRSVAPHAFTLEGDMRSTDLPTFRPYRGEPPAEFIPPEDSRALHLRSRFDGGIFGVRGPHGRVLAYAALKLKSASVWEIAVATEPEYRGRGYARAVVSAATAHALDHSKTPLYIHDRENAASAFVARSLGFRAYAAIVLAEY